MTASPTLVRFRRAIERRALWLAEDAARELPNPSLADALLLVHLFAERGSPKFEPAARRWLVRYLTEETPSLHAAAKVTASLAARRLDQPLDGVLADCRIVIRSRLDRVPSLQG